MIEATIIIEEYNNLLVLINRLKESLNNLPTAQFWINGAFGSEASKEAGIAAIANFYADLETPQQTFSCPGVIGGSSDILELVKALNNAKDNFKKQARAYLQAQDTKDTKDTKIIRKLLAQAGYSNVKLKQVYRQIRWIDYHPRRLSFTKVKHNSHKIINKKEAAERLHKVGQGFHIKVQQDMLNKLEEDTLVLHRDVRPIWAVNVSTFKDVETGISHHRKFLTSIPIVYLYDNKLSHPQVVFSQPHLNRQTSVRNDKQIEDVPFLPSISAYRYKK